MFRGREGGKPDTSGALNSVLGDGSQLSGNLRIQGSIRLDGEFEGRLAASGTVVIGQTGSVRADLEAREIVVAGRMEGRLIAQERVELQTGARVEGDVCAQSFIIAEGVSFNGNCSMGEEARGAFPAGAPRVDPDERTGSPEGARALAVVDSARPR